MNRSRITGPRLAPVASLFLAATLLFSTASLAVPQQAHAAYPSFTLSGSGWGHGIGMSQWGAKGWADRGKSWQWIATYYFPGSYFGDVSDKIVNVNLDNASRYRSSWRLAPASGARLKIGSTWGKTGESFTFTSSSGRITAAGSAGTRRTGLTSPLTVTTDASPRRIKVLDGSGYYGYSNKEYRGDMKLVASSSSLKLLNVLGIEGYLKGVLPGEIGPTWDHDALAAQAVCARSFAWIKNGELACNTSDQVYVGYTNETAATNSAVDATAGKVLKHSAAPSSTSKVIQTFFHSSSGGHTAAIEDVWPGTGFPSSSYPYFGGVPDPYCFSSNDPWKTPVTLDGMALAKKLAPYVSGEPSGAGSSVWVKDFTVTSRASSGFVRAVRITWSNGAVTQGVAGGTIRSALGLKSTKFYLGGPYTRLFAADRYLTAIAVSKQLYPSGGAKAVVITNGADKRFPDAISAAGLAGAVDGPVLFSRDSSLGSDVEAEIKRLGVSKAYVVGGTQSVPSRVQTRLGQLVGGSANVERLAGDGRYGTDRYGTAASVAMKMKQLGVATGSTVLVASGESWADATLAGTISAMSGRPIVLTAASSLPKGSANLLRDLGARETAVFGGPAAIGSVAIDGIVAITGESEPHRRLGAKGTRYNTAVEAAKWADWGFGSSASTVYLASGQAFPDAICGGVLAGRVKHPLLLSANTYVPTPTATYLKDHRAETTDLVVLGGPAAINDGTAAQAGGFAD